MDSSSANVPLLMIDDVRRTKRERDSVALEVARLTDLLAKLNAKLDGIKPWLSPELEALVFKDVEPEDDGEEISHQQSRKWAPVIIPMITDAGHGLTTREVKDKLFEINSPLFNEIGFQGAALYNALSKMVKKGELIKDGNYYCRPGQGKPEIPHKMTPRGVYEDWITQALSDDQSGLTSSQLFQSVDKLTSETDIEPNETYFQKTLSGMVANNRVVRQGHRYFPVSENTEADEMDSGKVPSAASEESSTQVIDWNNPQPARMG